MGGINKVLHISFDDINICIKNLKKYEYDSVFDEDFFGFIKELHEKNGAVISLYCYTDTFNNMPNFYQKELGACSKWLKFGIHAPNEREDYSKYSYSEAKKEYELFVKEILQLTGTVESIDRCPRLHCFTASKEAILGMRDAENGIWGLITAEKRNPNKKLKNRISYQLDPTRSNETIYYDELTKIYYIQTAIRCDWLVNWKQWVRVYTLSFGKVELLMRSLIKKYDILECFAHEWNFEARDIVRQCAIWGEKNDLKSDFIQNIVSNKSL